jgi:hypothetical protein
MKTSAVGAILVALLSSQVLLPAQAAPTAAEAQLPAVDADMKMAPLTPEQLSPSERAIFAKLKPGSAEATKFLHTRGYLRFAKLVVDKKLELKKLPDLPARQHWSRAYLTADEAKIVDAALTLDMASHLKPYVPQPALAATAELPAVDADGKIAPLTPQQLDPAERKVFDTLAAGSAEATKYLYTRGFLRYAKLVVDRKIEPLRLPSLPAPEHWNRAYFSQDEAKKIVDVALGYKMLAMMKPAE